MKVFLSYSNLDRDLAGQIKHVLEDHGLEVFLAHEDIEPLAEWVDTIRAELEACDVFIPVLTKHFNESNWTDQETGIIIARNKLIIPLKITVDPHGFISRFQALKIDVNKIPSSCHKILKVIASKPVFRDLFRDALIKKFGNSWSFENANDNTELLLSFEEYTVRQVIDIIKHAIANEQINQSFRARRKLRNFIRNYKDVIDSELLRVFYEATE